MTDKAPLQPKLTQAQAIAQDLSALAAARNQSSGQNKLPPTHAQRAALRASPHASPRGSMDAAVHMLGAIPASSSSSTGAAPSLTTPVKQSRKGQVLEQDLLDLGPAVIQHYPNDGGGGPGGGGGGGLSIPIRPGSGGVLSSGAPVMQPISPTQLAGTSSSSSSSSTSITASSSSSFHTRRPSPLTAPSNSGSSQPASGVGPVMLPFVSPSSSRADAVPIPSSSSSLPHTRHGRTDSGRQQLEDETADTHSTPEPRSASHHVFGFATATAAASPRSSPRAAHSSSAGSSRSTWPSGTAGVDLMPRGALIGAGGVGGAGPSSSPGPQQQQQQQANYPPPSQLLTARANRSQSAILSPEHVGAMRAVLHQQHPHFPVSLHEYRDGSDFGAASSGLSSPDSPFDFSDLRAFVHSPLPRGALLSCMLYRDRSASRSHPTFVLCAEEGPPLLPVAAGSAGQHPLPNSSPSRKRAGQASPPLLAMTGSPLSASSAVLTTAASASSSSSSSFSTCDWLPARRALRVLLYASKVSSSRYVFFAARPGDADPLRAWRRRKELLDAAGSTPTLSPMLLGRQHTLQGAAAAAGTGTGGSGSGGGGEGPTSPSAAAAGSVRDGPNGGGGQNEDAEQAIGVMNRNFLGNKYSFTCKPPMLHTVSSNNKADGGRAKLDSSRSFCVTGTRTVSSPNASAISSRSTNKVSAIGPKGAKYLASLPGGEAALRQYNGGGNGSTPNNDAVGSDDDDEDDEEDDEGNDTDSSSEEDPAQRLPAYLSTTGGVDIEYEINLFSRAPRHISVALPPLRSSAAEFLARNAATASSAAKAAANCNASGNRKSKSASVSSPGGRQGGGDGAPMLLVSNQPRWNSQRQCHTLNFSGRAPVPSLKNFQLVAADYDMPVAAAAPNPPLALTRDPSPSMSGSSGSSNRGSDGSGGGVPSAQRSPSPLSAALSPLSSAADATNFVANSPRSPTTAAASGCPNSSNGGADVGAAGPPPSILLQLGRMGPHEFSVDMRHPLTPLQAFAIVLSQFDGKIGVD